MMVLWVQDCNNEDVAVVNVMTIEYTKGSKEFKIWDYNDNSAIITMKSDADAERCVRNLYNSGKVQIEGDINWEE